MEVEEEFNLLKDYMKYFINLKYRKEVYFIKKREWDGNGPQPRLNAKTEKELEPISFEKWKEIYVNCEIPI